MNELKDIKKLLSIFDKSFLSVAPLIGLFLISTLIDILSIAIIAPYISFLLNPDGQFFFQKIIYFNLKTYDYNSVLIFFSLALIFIFFLKFILALNVRYSIKKFTLNCRRDLQMKLLKSYQSMSYSNFSSRGSADFIKNVRELSGDCITTLDSCLRIASEALVFTAVIIYLSWTQLLVVLTLLFLIIVFISVHNFFLKPKTIRYGKNRVEAMSYIYQAVEEGLKGFKEIKILNKEKYFKNMQKIGLDKVFNNELKSELIMFYPRYLYELIIVIFIIVFVSIHISYGGNSTELIPIVGTFAVASLRIIPSMSIISTGFINIQYSQFAIDIINRDANLISEEKNLLKLKSINQLDRKIDSIELKDIKFKYPNSNNFIFENLNLIIKKNECVGIVGENGSGKTTLVDILLGLLKPKEGKILVNGSENNYFNLVTKKIGYIPQDHLIISGKIVDNITLEIDESLINQEKLHEAITSANLNDLISQLPQGTNTLIGKNGIRLSGGQYKKLALARLFYHDKDILILDEATNSLDKNSEEIITNEIKRIKQNKTIIVISHNSKALNACDKILKIRNKRIEIHKN